MKDFATLVQQLGSSTGSNDKLEALVAYFEAAADADKVWVIAIFTGRRPRRIVTSTMLQSWCAELANLPLWLFEECYHTVGDLAETIAHLLPPPTVLNEQPEPLSNYLEQLQMLEKETEEQKKEFIVRNWQQMNQQERFVFNKLITGGFRIGVSQKMMVNALARTVQLEPSIIAHRISGNWDARSTSFTALLSEDASRSDHSKPYPFYLAYALDEEPSALGDTSTWQAEWKWDGIRGQIIKRNDELFVWSRGEELMTAKFPEYQQLLPLLPNGIAIDGEIISMHQEASTVQPLPFSALQTRIGRKNVSRKQLQEAPAAFIAYDLLELNGTDLRHQPLWQRRQQLETLAQSLPAVFRVSPIVSFNSWEQLAAFRLEARENGSEGLMLKRTDSVYQTGRKRGDWWKWKMDPLVIDCVLIYAQKGHGRRSNLYTDYTFAVRDGEKLVTFTKAYSGLTDKEFAEVDVFVKKNSIEKFGPVRTVTPQLVFEIAFEGIAASSRHKSGVALRFPRMNRWRKDKTVDEINTLDDLKALLKMYGK